MNNQKQSEIKMTAKQNWTFISKSYKRYLKNKKKLEEKQKDYLEDWVK